MWPMPADEIGMKDKTLVEILDRLKSLENKVDRLPTRPVPVGFGQVQSSPSSQPSLNTEESSAYAPSSYRPAHKQSPSEVGINEPYRHASASHKMLTWPAIQQLLLKAYPSNLQDLQDLESEGSAFIIRMQKGTPNLPMDDELKHRPFVGMQMQATRTTGGPRVIFPDLTYDTMLRLAESYFDTFNLMYPFMDRQNFLSETMLKVSSEGFNGDTESVIALLVFALGQLALESTCGSETHVHRGRQGGLRIGSNDRPPGLALFNEARKRIGFVMTECDLENVQIFSLAANRREADPGVGLLATVSIGISGLSDPSNMFPHRLDVAKRRSDQANVLALRYHGNASLLQYRHLLSSSTDNSHRGLHLELDLPLTGIVGLEDRVGLPSFDSPFCEADHRGNQYSHFEAHFASQIALRRLCANLHSNINDSMSSVDTPATSEDFGGPTASTLKQLASQLDQWRGLLPRDLRWPEDDPTASPPAPQDPDIYAQSLDPSLATPHPRQPGGGLFTTDLSHEQIYYEYAYDIQVALLRTRYYYAKYMVHRPFVYKALHFPEQMTREDAEGAATCLKSRTNALTTLPKSCLKWPITLSPVSCRKRLVPYLFCWSPNFLGILLILHLTRHTPILRHISTQFCGPTFDADAEQSTALMLNWIRDLKASDPIAQWCWNVLREVYHMDP
ncbi:MAG: hypothetical protein M1818_001019 [Claussenomyces sp. TS43310]|nr:MAG: hypothetical protein M1818_001019 [Claussenomyces sp. TS43310]